MFVLLSHRHALDLDPVDELCEEGLPHVSRQLREGGEQGGLEEVLGEVLVQHVAQGDRLGIVHLERWIAFCKTDLGGFNILLFPC